MLTVQAQRPHSGAQPSEAYTWLIRARWMALVIADLISLSLRTLQLQTIMAHSKLDKRTTDAVHDPGWPTGAKELAERWAFDM